jgi:hypothetical protein
MKWQIRVCGDGAWRSKECYIDTIGKSLGTVPDLRKHLLWAGFDKTSTAGETAVTFADLALDWVISFRDTVKEELELVRQCESSYNISSFTVLEAFERLQSAQFTSVIDDHAMYCFVYAKLSAPASSSKARATGTAGEDTDEMFLQWLDDQQERLTLPLVTSLHTQLDHHSHLYRSMYALQLQRYFSVFGSSGDRWKIALADDFDDSPADFLNSVVSFLKRPTTGDDALTNEDEDEMDEDSDVDSSSTVSLNLSSKSAGNSPSPLNLATANEAIAVSTGRRHVRNYVIEKIIGPLQNHLHSTLASAPTPLPTSLSSAAQQRPSPLFGQNQTASADPTELLDNETKHAALMAQTALSVFQDTVSELQQFFQPHNRDLRLLLETMGDYEMADKVAAWEKDDVHRRM